jgi:hypothetical protein
MAKKKRPTPKNKLSEHTTLDRHTRLGSKLTPPMAQLPNLKTASWKDDRMPEMLWAGLLFSGIPREKVIKKVNDISSYISQFRESENPPSDISMSGLAKLQQDISDGIFQLLTSPEEFGRALSPLLLFDSLPARNIWEKYLIGYEPEWHPLMVAVAKILNHQSQESTDCRWVRVIFLIAAGKLYFVENMEEVGKEIIYYPKYGDLRKVRPSIRSIEGTLSPLSDPDTNWARNFWTECLEKTSCSHLSSSRSDFFITSTTIEKIGKVNSELFQHCHETRVTSAVDAKHESIFGITFYSLRLLMELMRINASQTISAQLVLRTLVECFITLVYLTKKDEVTLWKSYRVFGAGQAKLSYLKLEASEDSTNYVNIETLKELANEDLWEEFLPIELGHWDNTNLRKLSEEAGVKDIYDRYYSWTSSYLHGHWGPIRDTVYEICGNPLHRLHRIPIIQPQLLPDVLPDVCKIIDLILEIVSNCYPSMVARVSLE